MDDDRLTRLVKWLSDDAPCWLAAYLSPSAEWLRCKVHGHGEYVEMDGRSHVCPYCNSLLWQD